MFLSLSSTISTVLMGASSVAYRQGDGEGGAFAQSALEPHLAAVQLDEAPREGKAEPGPLRLASVVAPDLLELLEYRGVVLGRNTDAGVAHLDFNAPIQGFCGNADLAAVWRELHGIGQQVDHDLLELALVGLEAAQAPVDVERHLDAVALRTLAHQGHGVRQRARQVEAGELEVHAPGLDLRQIQDVVDEREQVLARLVDVLQVIGLLLV